MSSLVAIFNSYHYTAYLVPFLISLLFSGLLLTVCKCGFDTMAPVERAKWMTSAWDCTLGYGCVHWTSRPTMDCSGVHLFTMELLWTVFHKLLPPPSPPPHPQPPALPPTPSVRWPKIGAHLQKNDLK